MSLCKTCSCERLLHDSWGCKICKSGCGVSIIYLSQPDLRSDKTVDEEVVKRGYLLDSEADKLEELRIKTLYQRAIEEQGS